MQHDLQLRAAARAIYENVYPTEEWAPVSFDQAERFGTVGELRRELDGRAAPTRQATLADWLAGDA